MKKLLNSVALVLLTLVLSVSLVACSSYGKVEKALKNIGYTVIESSDKADDMEEESDVAVTVHVFSNADSLSMIETGKLNTVIVMEFKATEDMKEFYQDSNTMQGLIEDVQEDGSAEDFYNSLVEKGYANGNCLVISITFSSESAQAVRNAVKNA